MAKLRQRKVELGKLKESEEQYKTLIQTIPDITYELDSDGKFIFVSDAVKRLEYNPCQLIGKHFRDILHPDDFEAVNYASILPKYKEKITGDDGAPKLFNERRTAARITKNLQVRIALKDREGLSKNYFHAEVNSSGRWDRPVQDKNKKFLGSIGIIRDADTEKNIRNELSERIKELTCIYNFCKIIEEPAITLNGILQKTAELLPSAFQYPNLACARITFEGKKFKTNNFKTTSWKQFFDIKVHGEKAGNIEIYYLREYPTAYEGPFLKEERDLMGAVSRRLGRVAERIKAQELLQLSEEKLKNYLENTPDIIMEVNRNGRIDYINYALPGYDIQTISGKKTIYEFILPQYHKLVRECIEGVYKTKRQSHYEIKGMGTDGNIRYYSTKISPLIKDNEIKSTIHIARDITERKKAEEKQIATNREKAAYLDAMADGVIVHDSKGNVVAVNPTWERMHGYKREEVEKLSPQEFFTKIMPPDSIQKAQSILKAILEKGTNGNAELSVHAKDGRKFPTLISFSPLTDEKGNFKGMIVSAKDITERKKMEEKLKEDTLKLQGQKMALERKNLTLEELLEHMERAKNKIKEDITTNIEELIIPILEKLELKGVSQKYIKLLYHYLEELSLSFGRKITQSNKLSPREVEICSTIKGGLSSKEISELLNISYKTIDKHRRNIRKKLGISKKRVNLVTFLQKL